MRDSWDDAHDEAMWDELWAELEAWQMKCGKLADLLARAVARHGRKDRNCCNGRDTVMDPWGLRGPHVEYVHENGCWWMEAQLYLEENSGKPDS